MGFWHLFKKEIRTGAGPVLFDNINPTIHLSPDELAEINPIVQWSGNYPSDKAKIAKILYLANKGHKITSIVHQTDYDESDIIEIITDYKNYGKIF